MAVNKGEIGIYGILRRDGGDGILVKTDLIQDDALGKTQELLNLEAVNGTALSTAHIAATNNPHKVTKAQVGLDNVTNDEQVKRSEMGKPLGVATLDGLGKVLSALLPSYVDDVLEYETVAKFPQYGESGKIYVETTTNLTYRWTGTLYVEISKSISLGETASTAYAGDKGKDVADKLAKVRNTLLSHIKDTGTFSATTEKVSLNYECYVGDQYGGNSTSHSVDLPVVSETQAGIITAADKKIINNVANIDAAVKTETSRATVAEEKISASVETEVSRAKAEEVSLSNKIADNTAAIKTETDRATTAEAVIDAYVGKSDIPEGKTVMGVIVENEETTANSIKSLATTSGLLGSDDEIAYTAPTTSGEFSTTTSIMDMLNHIDSVWNTIDCGSY